MDGGVWVAVNYTHLRIERRGISVCDATVLLMVWGSGSRYGSSVSIHFGSRDIALVCG